MMQLHTTQLTGLLGAIMISAGLASPIALAARADEVSEPTQQTAEVVEPKVEENQESMVEVRISLPNGKTVVRLEPSRRMSARRGTARSARATRKGSGGVRSTSGRSSGGSSGSGGAALAGHGASGGSAGSHSGGGSSGGGSVSGSSGGSSSGGAAQGKQAEMDLSGAQLAHRAPHSGVQSVSGNQSGTAVTNAPASGVSQRASSSQAGRPKSVPTIGAPEYNQDGATGGQRVEFRDAGMGAAVIGNTVYFNGIEHVRADQMFDVVTGTKIGGDMVIVQAGRLSSTGSQALSTWNTRASGIKLDFPSNTTVTFTMLSQPLDASNPERIERTWTVRIR